MRQWPEHYVVRRASVNNFGYGGANAHVILEAHETYNSPVARPKSIKSRTANDDFIDAVKFTDGTTDVDSIGSSNSTHGTDTEDSSVDLDTAYSTDTSVRPDSVRNKLSRRLASARRAEYVNRESRNDFVESEMSHATGVPSQTLQSRVFMLSANDEDALESMKIRLKDYVLQRAAQDGKPFLDDIAYTLGSRRSIFKFTSALAATSPESLASALENATLQPIRAIKNPRIGFVFTGQGAQWARMGQELINTYPVFRRTLVRADEHVRSLGAEWSLIGKSQYWHICLWLSIFFVPLSIRLLTIILTKRSVKTVIPFSFFFQIDRMTFFVTLLTITLQCLSRFKLRLFLISMPSMPLTFHNNLLFT